jgi:hypothetical protein
LIDDGNIKLTKNSIYEIKVRRRRTCQLKALVITLAIFAAICIGCIMTFFFIKYAQEHDRYLKYTKNMVAERDCKLNFFSK